MSTLWDFIYPPTFEGRAALLDVLVNVQIGLAVFMCFVWAPMMIYMLAKR